MALSNAVAVDNTHPCTLRSILSAIAPHVAFAFKIPLATPARVSAVTRPRSCSHASGTSIMKTMCAPLVWRGLGPETVNVLMQCHLRKTVGHTRQRQIRQQLPDHKVCRQSRSSFPSVLRVVLHRLENASLTHHPSSGPHQLMQCPLRVSCNTSEFMDGAQTGGIVGARAILLDDFENYEHVRTWWFERGPHTPHTRHGICMPGPMPRDSQ